MSLRIRTLIIIGGVVLLLTAILYILSRNLWLTSYVSMEEQNTQQDAHRALNVLSDMLANMNATAEDWAAWDDTYDFIKTGDAAYIEANLSDETFSYLKLNLMLFCNLEGQLLYGKAFDLLNGEEVQLSQDIQQILSKPILTSHVDIKHDIKGIVRLHEGPMLVVSRPIIHSDQTGPIQGSLIIGRYLDETEMEHLGDLTQLTLQIFPYNQSQAPQDLLQASANLSTASLVYVQPLDRATIAGYGLIVDVFGEPAYILKVNNSREIYAQGLKGITYLIFAFFFAGILSGSMLIFHMEKMVLGRLAYINNHVKDIGASGDPAMRISISGKDEFANLSDGINRMLESLDNSQKELNRTHSILETQALSLVRTNKDYQKEITERTRMEEALKIKTHQQERLIEAAHHLTSSLDVRQVLERIGNGVKEILEADGCAIYLIEEDGLTLRPVVVDAQQYSQEIFSTSLNIDQSLTGQAVKAKRGLIFNDAGNNPTGYQIPGTPKEEEERIIVAPFIVDNEAMGAMCVDRNERPFTKEDLALAETLAAYASSALKNAQAHDKLNREVEDRRTAETALRESEERYRTLMENINIGVYRTSPGDRGKYLMANPAFLSMFGFSSLKELEKIAVADVYVDPSERKAFSEYLLAQGRVDDVEIRLKKRDGSVLWGAVTARVGHDEDNQPFFDCTIEDVTKRKRAEGVKNALYKIAQATLTASTMDELFIIVHRTINELISTKNYYVALYDETTDTISFPYFVDEHDPKPEPQKSGLGLTEYVLRTGKPLLASPDVFAKLVEENQVELIGAPSLDWLGVPLKTTENKTIGALVTQTYDEGVRFTQDDLDLLTFVSAQIALAIERKRAEDAANEQREYLMQVVDINPNLIFSKDREGRFTLANQAIASAYGTTVENLIGKTDADFNPNLAEVQAFHQDDLEVIETLREKVIPEEVITDAAGRKRWLQTVKRPLVGLTEEVQVLGVATDITERKRAEEQLTHNAFHDSLTSLPNRTLFIDRLGHAIERSKRRKEHWFAVLFLDLDRFKTVNDSLGHVFGDQLLISAGHRLQVCLRTSDTIARFGGDEFVMLLEDLDDTSDVIQIANRILQEMTEPFSLAGHEIQTTASIGVVYSTLGYEKPEDILRDADIAMYRAKEEGRGRYVVFNSAMRAHVVAHLELENDLRYAIERGELLLHYQPIYSFKSTEMIGLEALVRWQHPKHGLKRPASFIPLAEETGLIIPMGKWVLHEACQQMHIWQKKYPHKPPLSISVNISNKQFSQMDLYEQTEQILKETNFNPKYLRLEITESTIMENAEQAIAILNRLRKIGVQVHIDDFGTGYSSLIYLHLLPINAIKIDRSFISGNGMDRDGVEIVQTIIKLAHELKLETIAEGVETQDQMNSLKKLGCEYAQGYHISECLDSQGIDGLLSNLKKRIPGRHSRR